MSARCEVIIAWRPQERVCGAPVEYRYAAMGGGYHHMCAGHAQKHLSISERLVDGQWIAPSPPPPSAPAWPYHDPATGRALWAWMQGRGLAASDVARQTGYAVSSVRSYMRGHSLSGPARRRLAAIGFTRALEAR